MRDPETIERTDQTLGAIAEVKRCAKCGIYPRSDIKIPSLVLKEYCSTCILNIVAKTPDPACEHCLGDGGEYFGHSENCEFTYLPSAGCHGCSGQMITCRCSILNSILDKEIDVLSG